MPDKLSENFSTMVLRSHGTKKGSDNEYFEKANSLPMWRGIFFCQEPAMNLLEK
jgi:hypothetical protein